MTVQYMTLVDVYYHQSNLCFGPPRFSVVLLQLGNSCTIIFSNFPICSTEFFSHVPHTVQADIVTTVPVHINISILPVYLNFERYILLLQHLQLPIKLNCCCIRV